MPITMLRYTWAYWMDIHTPDDPPTSIQASSNVEVAAHWTTICTAPAESDTNTNRHTGMDHRTHDELTWEVYDIEVWLGFGMQLPPYALPYAEQRGATQ